MSSSLDLMSVATGQSRKEPAPSRGPAPASRLTEWVPRPLIRLRALPSRLIAVRPEGGGHVMEVKSFCGGPYPGLARRALRLTGEACSAPWLRLGTRIRPQSVTLLPSATLATVNLVPIRTFHALDAHLASRT